MAGQKPNLKSGVQMLAQLTDKFGGFRIIGHRITVVIVRGSVGVCQRMKVVGRTAKGKTMRGTMSVKVEFVDLQSRIESLELRGGGSDKIDAINISGGGQCLNALFKPATGRITAAIGDRTAISRGIESHPYRRWGWPVGVRRPAHDPSPLAIWQTPPPPLPPSLKVPTPHPRPAPLPLPDPLPLPEPLPLPVPLPLPPPLPLPLPLAPPCALLLPPPLPEPLAPPLPAALPPPLPEALPLPPPEPLPLPEPLPEPLPLAEL